jgi:hypothetical protein
MAKPSPDLLRLVVGPSTPLALENNYALILIQKASEKRLNTEEKDVLEASTVIAMCALHPL